MAYELIHATDFNEARKKIREARKEAEAGKEHGKDIKIAFTTKHDELARKVLEKEQIDALIISLAKRKDRIKERDSGFNQVLAKLAAKKKIAIGIDIDEMLSAGKKEKAEMLARARQNIMLCRKENLKMIFYPETKKDQHDLKALGLVLGMPTWMTKSI